MEHREFVEVLRNNFSKDLVDGIFFKRVFMVNEEFYIWISEKYPNWREEKSILLILLSGSHLNFDKFKKQIDYFLERNKGAEDINPDELILKVCEFYSQDLRGKFQLFDNNERLKNIARINTKQENDIKKQLSNLNADFSLSKNQRYLVLYFRNIPEEQYVDSLDFLVVCFIVNWYINSGFSKVFTAVKIVSRFNISTTTIAYLNRLPLTLFPDIKYESVKNDTSYEGWGVERWEFDYSTNIISNVVHFTIGSISRTNFLSIPIIPKILVSRRDLGQRPFITWDIYYKDKTYFDSFPYIFPKTFAAKRDNISGDFRKLMDGIIGAVVELENRMIEESKDAELTNI